MTMIEEIKTLMKDLNKALEGTLEFNKDLYASYPNVKLEVKLDKQKRHGEKKLKQKNVFTIKRLYLKFQRHFRRKVSHFYKYELLALTIENCYLLQIFTKG